MKLNELLDKSNQQEKLVITWLLNQNDELLVNNINKCPDENFNKCWSFIVGNANKMAVNNCACIQDEQVYQWAKDYFNDYEVREEQRKNDEKKHKLENQLATLKNRKNSIISGYDKLVKKELITNDEFPKEAIENISITEETIKISSSAFAVYEEKLRELNEKFKNQLKVVVAESSDENDEEEIEEEKAVVKKSPKKEAVKKESLQQQTLFDFL